MDCREDGFHRKGAKSAKKDLRVLRAFAVRGIQTDANGNRTARFVDTDSSGTLNTGDMSITQYTWDQRQRSRANGNTTPIPQTCEGVTLRQCNRSSVALGIENGDDRPW